MLIEGESGSGKELVAFSLHRLSARAREPYLALNCAAISPTLVEPTLFGYAKGAFTGAQRTRSRATSRTRATARCSWTRSASCRSSCRRSCCACWRTASTSAWARPRRASRARASSPPPTATCARRCAQGAFRADLYHRLSVFTLGVPPLRELGDDKLDAARPLPRALRRRRRARSRSRSTTRARARWLAYDFPGNVRELKQHRDPPHHQVRRATPWASAELEPEFDAATRRRRAARRRRSRRRAPARARRQALQPRRDAEGLERATSRRRSRSRRATVSQAAKLLGVNRTTLYSRLESAGDRREDEPSGEIRDDACTSSISACASRRSASRRTPISSSPAPTAAPRWRRCSTRSLHDEGIVKVTGEVGSGKTMLCRVLMERLPADGRDDLPRGADRSRATRSCTRSPTTSSIDTDRRQHARGSCASCRST